MTDVRDGLRGAMTLVLGDVEGSTPLWSDDPTGAARSIERLGVLVADTVARLGGSRPPEQGEGDSFVALFDSPAAALSFAVDLQLAIVAERWPHGDDLRLRLAMHTGDVVVLADGRYAGVAFSRCARLRGLAHGGQSLVSQATRDLLSDGLPDGVTLVDLGSYEMRGLAEPERVFQLVHDDLPERSLLDRGRIAEQLPGEGVQGGVLAVVVGGEVTDDLSDDLATRPGVRTCAVTCFVARSQDGLY